MKNDNRHIGEDGENRAVEYLLKRNHTIIERNYRYKRAEVDIITQFGNCLHFVEVKTRKNNDFGYPEEFVSERKTELFLEAASDYIELHNWQGDVQFDIVAITNEPDAIHYIEGAFN